MVLYSSLFLIVSVAGLNAQLFAAHAGLGMYPGDSFGTESGYSSSDVYLNPMELAQIMDAQKVEEMRGYSPYSGGGSGGGSAPSYGGGGDGGSSPGYGGGGPNYDGPPAPAEPQGPPEGPPNGYGEGDNSEGPGDGPSEGSNYNGPEDEYSGPPQHSGGGGYNQGGGSNYGPQGGSNYGPQGGSNYGQQDGNQGGPGDNDGGYSNEGDAYRQEGDGYRQEGPSQQSHYQNEEERGPPGRGNGYNHGPPQHVENGYGQEGHDNYNGKYKQLIVERPHVHHGRPQGYQNENSFESNGPYENEQKQPTYESSGYENDKALKPHALPQAQYIQPSSGYSQPEEYESNNSPNERPANNAGFRPMNAQTATSGYNMGSTKEFYQNDPV